MKRITDKDLRKMIERAVDLGCEASYTGSGHVRLKLPNGAIVIAPTSPRVGAFAATKVRAHLRRNGLEGL